MNPARVSINSLVDYSLSYLWQGKSAAVVFQMYREYTVWRVIFVGSNFRGKSEKALKINFHDFKFRDSNQSRGVALLHK